MCGIAGTFCMRSGGRPSRDLVRRMTAVLRHRGPDAAGYYLDDRIAMGHTRLSIIDLSTGFQPIHNEDETLWIVYNGEVFNYPELREDLLAKGHRFYTESDTEVVLHLYEDNGPGCLDMLNGQFAFAVWNARKQELFIARDRVGIRPLYYTKQQGRFLFASEIKALFADPAVERSFDPAAISDYFTCWTALPGATAFKQIEELPPGHCATVTAEGIFVQQYWQIPFRPPADYADGTEQELCEAVRELLLDAVRIRLRADVPVGCYISGGLDSSGIAGMIAGNFDNRVKTFGIRFEESGFDESVYQMRMVRHLNVDHTGLTADNAAIGSGFFDVVYYAEQPLLRTAPVPLYLLSRAVHESGCKVVMTGEGADEVFGGYNIFRETRVRRFWAVRPDSTFRGLLIGRLYPYIFKNRRLMNMQTAFFARGLDRCDDPFFSHRIRWENTSKAKRFFSDAFNACLQENDVYEKMLHLLPESFDRWDYLAKAQYLETVLFLSNYLLSAQGDRVAMGNSLEIRLPYLDYRVIEFMCRVPPSMKIRGLREKYLLKKVFEGTVPDNIRNREKNPYRAPVGPALLHPDNLDKTMHYVAEEAIRGAGVFDAARTAGLIKKMRSSRQATETEHMALAGIVSTQVLHDRFIRQYRCEDTRSGENPAVMVDRRSK